MATASVPPPSKTGSHASDGLIAERIEAVRAALWRSELTRSVLILVLLLIGVLLGWAIIDQWIWSGGPMTRLAAWAAMLGLLLYWSARRILPLFRSQVDARYAAYSIERDIPEMKHALSSYVSLRDQRDTEGLRGVVVRSIGSRAAGRLQQHDGLLPSEVGSSFQLWMMVAAAFAVLAAYTVFSPKDTIDSAGRLLLPLASIDAPTRVRISEVEPGDTEIVAGKQLDVTARIRGLGDAERAQVIWETESAQRYVAMQVDPERGAPFYHASLGGSHGIEESGHYVVAAGDARSERFEIRTSDVPVVRVESVHYDPPAYTGQPERITRAAAIEGLEGTTVTLHASTNRPVAEAHIDLNPRTSGGRTTATAGVFPMQIDEGGTRMTAEIVLRIGADQPGVVPRSSYRLRVTDADGATNPDPVIYPIRTLPDLAPEVTIATPVRHPKDVPVDAQQLIEVHALDPDFGLTRVALRMQHGARQLEGVELWTAAEGDARNRVSLYRFRPQQLGLSSGDVITLRAVAEDNRRHPTNDSPAPNVMVSDPIELRIVDAARMSESRPSEDGLSAPDDQPAVDPQNQQQNQDQQPQSGQQQDGEGGSSGGGSDSSGSGQQSEGNGQSGGEGSSGGSGSETSEGSGSESGGSAGSGQQGGESGQESQGTGQGSGGQAGDQQGSSAGNESTSGAEGAGNQRSEPTAGSPDGAGSGNAAEGDPAAGDGASEGSASEASATDGAAGQPQGGTQQNGTDGTGEAMEATERGDGAGSQTAGDRSGTSGTEASGEGASGSESAGDGATGSPSSAAEGASTANGGGRDAAASSDGHPSANGNQGQQSRNQGSAQGQQDANAAQNGSAGASDGSESPSSAPSPPVHDGEAIERIKEYLENERQNGGDRSPAGERRESGDQSEDGSSSPGQQGNRDGTGGQRSDGMREAGAEGSPAGANSATGDRSANDESAGAGDSPRDGSREGSADDGTSQGGDPRGSESQDGGSQDAGSRGDSDSPQPRGDGQGSDSRAGESSAGQEASGRDAGGPESAGESNEGTNGTAESSDDGASSDNSAAPRDGTSDSSNGGQQPSSAGEQNREPSGSETNAASEPAGSQPPGGSSPGASPTGDPADGAPQGDPGETPPSGAPPSASDGSAPSGSAGSSAAGAGSEEFLDPNETPEPVDLEYAREATDMVLDYLKETRDQPDQELLDRLNWTEADMQRFLNRWESARQMERAAGSDGSEEFEEALRSLGLRDRSTSGRGAEVDQADRLRDLRDSGTRRPAPTLYRDAFEAFRRSVGQ